MRIVSNHGLATIALLLVFNMLLAGCIGAVDEVKEEIEDEGSNLNTNKRDP